MAKKMIARVAGVSSAGPAGIRLSPKGDPMPPWCEVQPEDMGEGLLTGHSIARDIMAFARTPMPGASATESVEGRKRLIQEAITSAVLTKLHPDQQDNLVSNSYAATAFLSDICEYLIAASAHVDIDAKFAKGSAYAERLIDRLTPLKETADPRWDGADISESHLVH